MPTTQPKAAKSVKDARPCLVFELDAIAFNGGQTMYEILAKLFKTRNFQLTPEVFIRFNLSRPTPRALNRMLTAMEINPGGLEAMSAEIAQQFPKKLAQTKPVPAVMKLLAEAARQGIPLGALTACPEDQAQDLVKALALKVEIALGHLSAANQNGRPRAETWIKLARQMQATPAQCIALTNCAGTTQAAIAAGMHAVAIPDAFSAYQDLGGADMVFEKTATLPLAEILALAAPVARK